MLIDDFLELTCERNKLFKVFADQKYKYMELNDDKIVTDRQNICLKKHVVKLESSNLDVKSGIVKMIITGKRKRKI